MFFVNQRWLGGLLTNFATIKTSLGRLRELDTGSWPPTGGTTRCRREVARLEGEKRKLRKNLDGIRLMAKLPDAVFVVDTHKQVHPRGPEA